MSSFTEKWDLDKRIEAERQSLIETALDYKNTHEDVSDWEESELEQTFPLTDEMIENVKYKFLEDMKKELLKIKNDILEDRSMLLTSTNMTATTKDTLKEDIKEYETEQKILEKKIQELEIELGEERCQHGR